MPERLRRIALRASRRPCPQRGLETGVVLMYYIYILRSEKDKGYYYGSSSDLGRRIKEHNDGRVKFTKSRRPWYLCIIMRNMWIGMRLLKRAVFQETIGLQVA